MQTRKHTAHTLSYVAIAGRGCWPTGHVSSLRLLRLVRLVHHGRRGLMSLLSLVLRLLLHLLHGGWVSTGTGQG